MTMRAATLASIFFRPALPPAVIACIAVVIVALAVVAYRRSSGASSRAARWGLLAMRTLGVIAVSSLLLGPSHVPPTATREVKPAVSVLVDLSESMRTADCGEVSRIDAVRAGWLGDAALDRIASVADLDLSLVGAFSEPIGRAAVRDIGFGPERGFGPRDIQLFEQIVGILFTEEVKLLSGRVSPVDADDAARMVEQALPRINEMLGLLHARRVRKFLGEFNAAK